jgi:hypothetical protein
MVCGLHQKWKQPSGCGSTKPEMTGQFEKEVLDACQDAGLHVVATVCDVGTNNIKALELLGVSEVEPFFKFKNKETATVFDPPYLLKCTQNLFHTYDVQMKSEPLGNLLLVIAKWGHNVISLWI